MFSPQSEIGTEFATTSPPVTVTGASDEPCTINHKRREPRTAGDTARTCGRGTGRFRIRAGRGAQLHRGRRRPSSARCRARKCLGDFVGSYRRRVRVGEAGAAGAVQVRTSGGSVEAGMAGQPDVDSELRTSGGNVTFHLPDGFQADLSVNASGGRISSDFPELEPENSSGGGTLEQSLNGGGPDLVMRTSGGSIRIRRLQD